MAKIIASQIDGYYHYVREAVVVLDAEDCRKLRLSGKDQAALSASLDAALKLHDETVQKALRNFSLTQMVAAFATELNLAVNSMAHAVADPHVASELVDSSTGT